MYEVARGGMKLPKENEKEWLKKRRKIREWWLRTKGRKVTVLINV